MSLSSGARAGGYTNLNWAQIYISIVLFLVEGIPLHACKRNTAPEGKNVTHPRQQHFRVEIFLHESN